MKRCVVVGGADINNYEYIRGCLREDDYIVFCDSGLKHMDSLRVKPNLKRGFDEFLLIGVIGARLDHTLGNVSILMYLDSLSKKGVIIDDYSEMEILSKEPAFIEDSFAYFSLINVSGKAKGIVVENAKYSLDNAEITCEYQYGISNDIISRCAKIKV